ncbi:hypothetical protein THOM_0112, partial [Trachipleistophora hominis]
VNLVAYFYSLMLSLQSILKLSKESFPALLLCVLSYILPTFTYLNE